MVMKTLKMILAFASILIGASAVASADGTATRGITEVTTSQSAVMLVRQMQRGTDIRAPSPQSLRMPDGSRVNTIVIPDGTQEATCVSGDGKKACSCDELCAANDHTCFCFKVE
jgi:hypothetical protein